MAEVRKISVSMPPEVVERVKLAAAATGESVSGWLTNAALEALDDQTRMEIARIDAERMVREYEEEFGPIPPEVTEDVRRFLADEEDGAGEPDGDDTPGLRDAG